MPNFDISIFGAADNQVCDKESLKHTEIGIKPCFYFVLSSTYINFAVIYQTLCDNY